MIIKKVAYGLRVLDDLKFPETEIFILGSPGQSGYCSLVIVFMGIDGGITGLSEIVVHIPHGKLKYQEISNEIRKGLNKIHQMFTPNYPFLNDKDVEKILIQWDNLWKV